MDALDPALFIGSSSEGLAVARELQAELDQDCQPAIWSQNIFTPGNTTFGELLQISQNFDFAALILTPDDSVTSRGNQEMAARDNVVFELGLFLGSLGPRRVFIIHPRKFPPRLPSDLAGVTLLNYNENHRNLRAAIGPAANGIRKRISDEGLRSSRELTSRPAATISAPRRGLAIEEEQRELNRELDAIETAAKAQGWSVRTRSDTAFRLVAKNGNRYSFAIGSPAETRDRLRTFAQQLNSAGLRISQPVLNPVSQLSLQAFVSHSESRRN
ncbi:MAG TPA: nucleotide-binding protein [Streptosporangiaceae bacterium]|nr:nucleotide-binding protein [Streptosporangiaceae bacterium]